MLITRYVLRCSLITIIFIHKSMSKQMLSKFKKSLQNSQKVLYEQRISLQPPQQPQQQFNIPNDNGHDMHDRSQMYRVVASNYQASKMNKKIPVLVSQNQELKQKVKQLEELIQSRRHHLSPSKCQTDYIRIQGQPATKERLSNSWRDGSAKDRVRISNFNQYYEQQNCITSGQKKRRNLAKLSSEVMQFFQGQIEQLKLENEHLQNKYQQTLRLNKNHSDDIDKLQHNFEQTLRRQDEMFKKQQKLFDQKLKAMQAKVVQFDGESQILKVQNSLLTQKLTTCEISLAVLKKQPKASICPFDKIQKQMRGSRDRSFDPSSSHIWQLKALQRQRSHSASRIKFNYPRK